jgi:hypothetical protein
MAHVHAAAPVLINSDVTVLPIPFFVIPAVSHIA